MKSLLQSMISLPVPEYMLYCILHNLNGFLKLTAAHYSNDCASVTLMKKNLSSPLLILAVVVVEHFGLEACEDLNSA